MMIDLQSEQAKSGTGQAVVQFVLPKELEAREPAEHRGLRRDHVRLMVVSRAGGPPAHDRFDRLGDYLSPGDLLVVNNSRTLPALLHAVDQDGEPVEVRLAHRRAENLWDVLLLRGRTHVGRAGMRLDLGDGLLALVLGRRPDLPYLWRVEFNRCCAELLDLIYRLGEPVRYTYVDGALPLDLYQTVYATEPGSVEMPSAGRPLTWELLIGLKRRGVGLAAISLHTGLSSTRDDAVDALHPNFDEEFVVPAETARLVDTARAAGGRVVAVGTTVVRALETAVGPDGAVRATDGWTNLRITRGHELRAVDGLLTGLHEPQASHLDLLSAFLDPAALEAAYREAVEQGYLWHEFGDLNLIL
jgi:S-adenosylmethionine:tRNA ribosyltransferase-isomerase